MNFRAYVRSKQALQGVSLAIIVSFGLAVGSPVPAHADNDSSIFAQMLRKKKFGDPVAATSNAGNAHTKGSGLKATTETAIVADRAVSPFLTPDSPAALQALADKYQSIVSSGGWVKVPSGKQKKGDSGKGPEALNLRLFAEGYLRAEATQGEFAQVFTSATEDALMRFQRNHGLAVTGTIDGPTLNELNVPADRRLATIRANIPRVTEYSKDLGERYVVVNVPAQQIETISGGKVFSLHNAIVGRPSRPTPVVMTPLKTVRFNPYWNAPASIVEKDIVPRMMSGGPSKVMQDMNMKIFDGVGGPEVDPDKINWRNVVVDKYHFRQEPGGSNAMATAKIEFNSPFGIYLHDTPEPQLFQTAQRFYSSGCVRVEKVAILINWILQGQDGIDANRIAQLAETKERLDTEIANPPQLRVAYLTAWPTNDGVAAFRDDVYELDGTGFVVGQPLPVGETQGGQRFVLKPIPRSQDAVDADEATGFASLFGGRGRFGSNQAWVDSSAGKTGDSLISTKAAGKTATAQSAKKAAVASSGKTKSLFGKPEDRMWANAATPDKDAAKSSDKKKLLKKKSGDKTDTAKADPKKKAGDKAVADASKKKPGNKDTAVAAASKKDAGTAVAASDAKAKKVVKTDETVVAAKKADDKTILAKKKALSDATKTASADPKADTSKAAAKPADDKAAAAKAKPADTKTADKKPDAQSCKAGSDGKVPAGCKPPAAKKTPPKPEKTAAATN